MNTKEVIIVGGGIAGLSAAWHLEQQGIAYTLLEASEHWGGKMLTEQLTLETPDGARFILDAGPESFITRKPEVWQMAHDLGIAEHLIAPMGETRGVNVLYQGEMHPLPISPVAFLRSRLLSTRGKLRVFAETFVRPRTDRGDETLADFASRRLGAEMAHRVIGPILGGIYNTDYEQQSVLVSAPQMRDMEREHGGLVRGALAIARQKRQVTNKPPSFITFKEGTKVLVDALVQRLTGELVLGTRVCEVAGTAGNYQLWTDDGKQWQAPALILATPANASAQVLHNAFPRVSHALAQLKHTGIGTLFLMYKSPDLPASNITSLMIPRREKRAFDAILWTSQRMPQRTPEGYTLLKIFFGGAQPDTLKLSDDALLSRIRVELAQLFGIQAEPVQYRVFRWQDSYPQAMVGHLEQVAHIESLLPVGLFITGSSYRGIGVPDCIRQGYQAAGAAADCLGSLTQISMKGNSR